MQAEQEIKMIEKRYTEKEVCDMYQIDRGTLRRWRENKILSFLRLPSGQIRYRQSDLNLFDKRIEQRAGKAAKDEAA